MVAIERKPLYILIVFFTDTMAKKSKKYKNKDQPYHTQKVRDFKKEHREKGLCVYCNTKAVKDTTMCQKHLEYQRYYKKFKSKKKGKK